MHYIQVCDGMGCHDEKLPAAAPPHVDDHKTLEQVLLVSATCVCY
jgi:hypothetical protein